MAEYTKIPISLYVLLMYVNKKGLIDNYFRRRQQILVRSDNQIWTPQLYLYIFLLYVYVFITYKRLKVINKTQPWISSPIQNRVFFYYYFFLCIGKKLILQLITFSGLVPRPLWCSITRVSSIVWRERIGLIKGNRFLRHVVRRRTQRFQNSYSA